MQHIPNYLFFIMPIGAALAFLVSLTIFFRNGSERYLKYFSVFLFFNFLSDAATGYTAFYRINNVLLNNLGSLLVIAIELYFMGAIVASRKAKRFIFAIATLYPVVAIVNIFLVQHTRNFHTMTYSLGSLLIVMGCIYYFWELFQQRTSIDLVRQPAFWICSGLLFYYCCTFPVYGLTNFIDSLPLVVRQNLFTILIVITICLYLSFIIAFICRLKTKRSQYT